MSDFLPFSRPSMGAEEFAALQDVLSSGWITTGPKNQALEEAFCHADREPACDCRQFCHRRNARHADGAGYWPGR